ncbi:hypothetical protein PLCT2_00253 [Planctomycetaceae bacterium]|nr:hypothetical protein PLCT2_00253 [Planctomycetaceae bacterium]
MCPFFITRRFRLRYRARRTRFDWLDIVDERRGHSRLQGLVFFRRILLGFDVHPDAIDLVCRQLKEIKPSKPARA